MHLIFLSPLVYTSYFSIAFSLFLIFDNESLGLHSLLIKIFCNKVSNKLKLKIKNFYNKILRKTLLKFLQLKINLFVNKIFFSSNLKLFPFTRSSQISTWRSIFAQNIKNIRTLQKQMPFR